VPGTVSARVYLTLIVSVVRGRPDPASPQNVRVVGRYYDLPAPTSCNVNVDDLLKEIHRGGYHLGLVRCIQFQLSRSHMNGQG
jgi:hypothetical protein